jgi:anti-sigma regulatory factor (Ser/Thr protein kinase)
VHVIDLRPHETSPGDARVFVSRWARAWGYRPLVPAAALLTSELATNAVEHGAGDFTVEVTDTGHGVRVDVRDPSPSPPVVRAAQDLDEHGRGMRIVEAVATAWGTEMLPHDGKRVWFELDAADPHGLLV